MIASAKDEAVEPVRVLVVDDQPAIVSAHARLIGRDGHQVQQATSVAEALLALDQATFDVVVSDVQMPDASGIDLLQTLRSRDPNVSVILVSGAPDLPTALQAIEFGAFEYLTKPISVEKLRSSVARAAALARERRSAQAAAEQLRSGERLRESASRIPIVSQSGELVGGRYRLGEKIGEGGMGVVYAATREDLGGMPVALKILHPHLGAEPDFLMRFRREAEMVASVDHPNVVRIIDFQVPSDGPAYLVMELLHGLPLSQVIAAKGPFSLARAISIAQQILAGLAIAHDKNIIHRDLKPDNVFVTTVPGLGEVARLLDFGIARFADRDESLRLTRTGAIIGTPAYMAPEQAKGQPFDKRGDIYAVGCILYEMLAGRPPFSAGNYNALLAAILEAKPTPLEQLRPDLPGTLCRIVTKAMNKAARARYQSPQEMSAELAKRSRLPKLTLPPASDPLESAPTIAVHPIRSVKPRRSPKK